MITDDPVITALTPTLIALGLYLAGVAIWPRPTAPSRPLMLSISAAFMAQYTWWRITETLPPAAFNFEYVIAIGFLLAETAGMLGLRAFAAVSLSDPRSIGRRRRQRRLARERGEASADRRTDLFLQRGSFDPRAHDCRCPCDGLSEFSRLHARRQPPRLVERPLRTTRLPLLARPDNGHAKAGNINHALRLLARLPDPPEFIAILDADFVPTPHFLKRAMTLFRDKTIGVVQTPQHFVNPDPIQINLGATTLLARRAALLLRRRHAGQGRLVGRFLLRHVVGRPHGAAYLRSAGFRLDSVTEDYLLTLRLKETGYATAYLDEPLSFGLAPEGLKEYVTQRCALVSGLHADRTRTERSALDRKQSRVA